MAVVAVGVRIGSMRLRWTKGGNVSEVFGFGGSLDQARWVLGGSLSVAAKGSGSGDGFFFCSDVDHFGMDSVSV